MKQTREFEGKNIESAIESACAALNISKNKLNYDVISSGSTGIFGIVGVKKAKIRVTLSDAASGKANASALDEAEMDGVMSMVDEAFGTVSTDKPAPEKPKQNKPEKKQDSQKQDSQKQDSQKKKFEKKLQDSSWEKSPRPDRKKSRPRRKPAPQADAVPPAEPSEPLAEQPAEPLAEAPVEAAVGTAIETVPAADTAAAQAAVPEAMDDLETNLPVDNAMDPMPDDEDEDDMQDEFESFDDDLEEDPDEGYPPKYKDEAPIDVPEEAIFLGREALQRMVDLITSDATVVAETDQDKLLLRVTGGNSGVLIGRRGQTLEAMQFLTDKIINRTSESRVRLKVDIEGYMETRKANLVSLAHKMADKAKKTGKPATINQMTAQDRRTVHLALKDDSGVRTQSMGDGYYRRLVIFPKKGAYRKRRPSRK